MASQVAIKMLGTNGGGYTNANAAHPFENPTPLSNFLQMLSIFAIGSGLTWYLGRMTKNQAHGWAVWATMMILFLAGVLIAWHCGSRRQSNPPTARRCRRRRQHGRQGSALRHFQFRAVRHDHDRRLVRRGQLPCMIRSRRSADSCRCSTSSSAKSFSAASGAGLYGMLVFVVLAVFIAGLMVGRTPEYLGKKIQVLRSENGDAHAADSGADHSRIFRVGGGERLGFGRT